MQSGGELFEMAFKLKGSVGDSAEALGKAAIEMKQAIHGNEGKGVQGGIQIVRGGKGLEGAGSIDDVVGEELGLQGAGFARLGELGGGVELDMAQIEEVSGQAQGGEGDRVHLGRGVSDLAILDEELNLEVFRKGGFRGRGGGMGGAGDQSAAEVEGAIGRLDHGSDRVSKFDGAEIEMATHQ